MSQWRSPVFNMLVFLLRVVVHVFRFNCLRCGGSAQDNVALELVRSVRLQLCTCSSIAMFTHRYICASSGHYTTQLEYGALNIQFQCKFFVQLTFEGPGPF